MATGSMRLSLPCKSLRARFFFYREFLCSRKLATSGLRKIFAGFLAVAAAGLLSCGSTASNANGGGSSPSDPTAEMLYSAPSGGLLNLFGIFAVDSTTGASTSGWGYLGPIVDATGMVAVDSRFLYVVQPATSGQQLYGYRLTANSGTLTTISTPLLATEAEGLASTPSGQYLYVAEDGKVEGFQVNSSTGALTAVPGSPYTGGQSAFLTVDPTGRFLYASDDNGNGSIDAYSITSTGALTPLAGSPFAASPQSSSTTYPQAIVATGAGVYVTLYGTGGIAAFSMNSSTGVLTQMTGSPYAAGSHTYYMVAAGNFIYATDLQTYDIFAYKADPGSGALTQITGSPYTQGEITLAVDPANRYLFVCGSYNLISSYSIDANSGALTIAETSFGSASGGAIMAAVNVPE